MWCVLLIEYVDDEEAPRDTGGPAAGMLSCCAVSFGKHQCVQTDVFLFAVPFSSKTNQQVQELLLV